MTTTRRERSTREKRLLQGAVVVFGFVPVLAGLAGAHRRRFPEPDLRNLLRQPPALPLRTAARHRPVLLEHGPPHRGEDRPLRLLTLIVVIGGLARAYALVVMGAPSTGMMLALGMELFVTPLLC